MEAAVVITPIPSHHSISVTLSLHGIHNITETMWCSTVEQARQMIQTARENGTIVRVAENFFRFPIDRIVKEIEESNFLGPIRRIVSYADHTGYHNNSRWIAFAGAHPTSVRSVEHTMPIASFDSSPVRHHENETYRCRFFSFPDDLLVVDHASNVKGFLGRHPRPGYTEWQGHRGTVVYAATGSTDAWVGRGEVRFCSSDALEKGVGHHDLVFPIVDENEEEHWVRTYTDFPDRRIEYTNVLPRALVKGKSRGWYGAKSESSVWYGYAVMDHLVDFSLAIRGMRASEFDGNDAMASLMMEIGAGESARRDGLRMEFPLQEQTETESNILTAQADQLGVDPMDVEAMLSLSFPKP